MGRLTRKASNPSLQQVQPAPGGRPPAGGDGQGQAEEAWGQSGAAVALERRKIEVPKKVVIPIKVQWDKPASQAPPVAAAPKVAPLRLARESAPAAPASAWGMQERLRESAGAEPISDVLYKDLGALFDAMGLTPLPSRPASSRARCWSASGQSPSKQPAVAYGGQPHELHGSAPGVKAVRALGPPAAALSSSKAVSDSPRSNISEESC